MMSSLSKSFFHPYSLSYALTIKYLTFFLHTLSLFVTVQPVIFLKYIHFSLHNIIECGIKAWWILCHSDDILFLSLLPHPLLHSLLLPITFPLLVLAWWAPPHHPEAINISPPWTSEMGQNKQSLWHYDLLFTNYDTHDIGLVL